MMTKNNDQSILKQDNVVGPRCSLTKDKYVCLYAYYPLLFLIKILSITSENVTGYSKKTKQLIFNLRPVFKFVSLPAS